jgi:hypothetical protein
VINEWAYVALQVSWDEGLLINLSRIHTPPQPGVQVIIYCNVIHLQRYPGDEKRDQKIKFMSVILSECILLVQEKF